MKNDKDGTTTAVTEQESSKSVVTFNVTNYLPPRGIEGKGKLEYLGRAEVIESINGVPVIRLSVDIRKRDDGSYQVARYVARDNRTTGRTDFDYHANILHPALASLIVESTRALANSMKIEFGKPIEGMATRSPAVNFTVGFEMKEKAEKARV